MAQRVIEIAGQQVRVEGFEDVEVAAMAVSLEVPFNDLLGLQWDRISPDRVEAHLEVEEKHHQPSGIVHGGVHCAVVEAVGSMAAVANVAGEGRFGVGVANSTDFLRVAREGTLHAVATPIHKGNSQHLWLVEISRDDGEVAARGQLRVHIVDPDRMRRRTP